MIWIFRARGQETDTQLNGMTEIQPEDQPVVSHAMDFQFTPRLGNNMKPVWANSSHDANIPSHHMFGADRGSSFLLNTSTPQTHRAHPWTPPPPFSPEKVFPQLRFQELRDIDMLEASPLNPEGDGGAAETGALHRVYKSYQRSNMKPVGATSWDDADTPHHHMFGADGGSPFVLN
ncbi:hypothetical protein FIBSPDRAFT_1043180, partial [Athelia psychrophila]